MPTCRDALSALLAADVATTAQLVELAVAAVTESLGALPVDLVDTDALDTPVSLPFRELTRSCIDSDTTATYTCCAAMSAEQRHDAAQMATNLILSRIRADELE
ncbi:hypothetical protein [Nocardia terpenica]|uniref:Uncharacterized protein n=1 Tax=Nocardia terpenica TaxID=455432 RepID=A0A6G9ZE40_9NOCA|nr:hypothetical protein [Nocardia terpenica]QIS23714.1 hypothetical protein F6W96_40980 [Nocardia terpenica]